MHKVNAPVAAKKDGEVMLRVEEWEEVMRDAEKRGMRPLDDMYKINILEDIVTEVIREKLENEFYTKYSDARELIMRSQETPKSCCTSQSF